MTAANLVSYSAQIAVLVVLSAGLPRLLGLRSPGLQYAFWRVLLAVCLILPFAQPWRHEEMAFVPAAPGALLPASAAIAASNGHAGPAVDWIVLAGAVLFLGIVARLAWLGLGLLRLRRLRRATPIDARFDDLLRVIGVSARVLQSGDVAHPVTFGLARPVVVLPASLDNADAPAQRAVVAHELHHVKRRDWAWVVGEEIVRSVFWFHPAVWWLISRVQLARETVVDELSILTTNERRAYLDALLAFADDTGLTSTPAFSARRHLFHRVMLLSKEGNMSSSRVALASCVLVAALGTGTWGVVRAFPLSHTIIVSVAHDQNLPADHSTPLQTRTTPDQLPPPPPPPPPPRDAKRMPPPPPPPPPDAQTDEPPMPAEFKATLERLHPIRLGKDMPPPTATTKSVKAEYPTDAQAARIQGSVALETIIDADGKVAAVRVVHSIPGLDEAAIEAAKQWEFTPPLLNGKPTPVLCTMVMNFSLK